MLKSWFKFLGRNRLYTAVEALGLTVSLAFVILIGSYVWQQYAVARENPDYKNLYVIGSSRSFLLSYGYCDLLAERIPEVTGHIRVDQAFDEAETGGNKIRVKILGIEPEFFGFFPCYRILSGSAEALRSRNSVLVSRSFAAENGLGPGDSFLLKGSEATVGGVFEDFRNTLFQPADILVGHGHPVFEYLEMFPFNFFGSVSFVKLPPGTDLAEFGRKLDELSAEVYAESAKKGNLTHIISYRLDHAFFELGVRDSQFFRTGDRKSIRMLLLVGLFLLISALFNYINLSFALTGKRAKEMAIRRLLGESRGRVLLRCIAESMLFTAFCFGLGLLLAVAFTPTMNMLMNDPDVPIRIGFSPGSVALYLLLVFLTGVLAGLLPALLAACYEPVDVVKGHFRTMGKMTFSKVFIVVQNTLSVFLLAVAFVMEAQYRYSQDRPLNLDISGKFYVEGPFYLMQTSFPDEIAAIPGISRVAYGDGAPGFKTHGVLLRNDRGEDISVAEFQMDSAMVAMLGIRQVRNFGVPSGSAVWFSEKTFRALGLDEQNPDLGPTLLHERWLLKDYKRLQIGGTYAGIPVEPSNIGTDADEYQMLVFGDRDDPFFISVSALLEVTGDRKEIAAQVLDAYRRAGLQRTGIENMLPNRYGWLEEHFLEALRPARNNMRLLELFMLLAILISLLGMFAMSTYYAGVRAKDIAVRKVFGGTVISETILNVRGYMALVGIACLIGIPAAVWASDRYLESYISRIGHYGWLFAAAVLLAAALSFLSVLWQTLRAARTNPAEELKKEQ